MPWSNQNGGGGPWGGGGSGGSGGGGKGPWGGGGGGGQQPPDIEELLRRGQDRMKKMVPGGGRAKIVVMLLLLLVAGWFAVGGFYRVQPDEQGVVLVFGEWVDTTGPGLHWNWPAPVGDVELPKVTQVNSTDIGYSGALDRQGRVTSKRDVPEESLILTGDQNIVDIDFTVQWKIKDAGKYLFNIRDPRATVKVAAESAMREVVGQRAFDWAVQGEGRGEIQAVTKGLLQVILDSYEAGIEVREVQLQQSDPPKEVIDAFNDVQRARQDKERLQNEAQAYANSIVPEARGRSEQMIQQAEAYKQQQISEAQGEAQRFLSVYNAYLAAPDVTRRRMYLETFGSIFGSANKIIIDEGASGSGVVPYLPLPELQRGQAAPPANQ
ncbi:MAG: FtsH protease activity modulator HflK [Rhodospirillales bacterium]|nr:MAG: FtsH protease activity modulator HflK [Rhodospirillales bacterium]